MRILLISFLIGSAVMITGCSDPMDPQTKNSAGSANSSSRMAERSEATKRTQPNDQVSAIDQSLPRVTVHKSPTCGCCQKWIDHMSAAGFEVDVINTENMAGVKKRLGIAPQYGSCHTAQVGGYAIEGHVPAADIKRLLSEKPAGIGLAVPGMPLGSPGMEVGGQKQPYDTLLLKPNHAPSVWAKHNQ